MRWAIFITTLITAAFNRAYEIEVHTNDGQLLQGAYVGMDQNVLRMRTGVGDFLIGMGDIATTTNVPAPGAAIPCSACASGACPLLPEAQPLDVRMLAAARLEGLNGGLANGDQREVLRAIRDFRFSSFPERKIAILRGYGLQAYPFLAAAYAQSFELQTKVNLLQTVAVRGESLSAGLLAQTHATAELVFRVTVASPPPQPPRYLTNRVRWVSPQDPGQSLQLVAGNLLQLEEYAATAGGPLNALFLWQTYRSRYSDPQSSPFLADLDRDRARLVATAQDASRHGSAWTASERALVVDQVLPAFFRCDDTSRELAQALLSRILPARHPKWSASEAEWAAWRGK